MALEHEIRKDQWLWIFKEDGFGNVNIYFKKKDEHRVTYKNGKKGTQIDYVICRRRDLKKMCNCKILVNEYIAKQWQEKKAEKVKPNIRWWELKETSCQETFRELVTRILAGEDGLPDEWDKTAEMLRKTAETAGSDIWETKRR